MSDVRILALDLSSKTGWAAPGPDRSKPVGGVLKIPFDENDNGEAFADLRDGIARLINLNSPTHVAIEAPVPVTSHGRIENLVDKASTVRFLLGTVAIAEEIAWRAGIECVEGRVNEVRPFFCGRGEHSKGAVQARCQQLGWSFQDDNEADAKALWAYATAMLDPTWSFQQTVTIGRKA